MKHTSRFVRLIALLFLLCILPVFTSCVEETASSSEAERPEERVEYALTLAVIGDGVDFHSDLQNAYLVDDYTAIGEYADGTAEESRPVAIPFSWRFTATGDGAATALRYAVEIATDASFSDYILYETDVCEADVYNLCVATAYYWRVRAYLSDGTTLLSDVGRFSTASVAPRNLYIDGVTNVRDLGGWETADGTRVRQGMIYRAGRLNESSSDEVVIEITKDGVAAMCNILGVVTEIDIRRRDNNEVGSITESPLGEYVSYYSEPMDWNVGNILTDNADTVAEVFSILADENNYPLVYHCNIGTDRTGMFAFLLNGLLGVSEEDLYRDYLFSNFGKIGSARTLDGIRNTYVATVKSYPGESLAEQIRNCLVDLGVNESDIDDFVRIMTE